MSYILYAYIAKPTTSQLGCFLRALENHGISISHLGKLDPPPKFRGSADEASSMVLSGAALTNYAFARDAARRLDFDFQIHNDPRWTHSTVSASCPDISTLRLVADSAAATFDLLIVVRGVIAAGKEQPWEVLQATEKCPEDLRAKFAV